MSRNRSWRHSGIGSHQYGVVEAIVHLDALFGTSGIWAGVPNRGLRVEQQEPGDPDLLRVQFMRWGDEFIDLEIRHGGDDDVMPCMQKGTVSCRTLRAEGRQESLGFAFRDLANSHTGPRFFDFQDEGSKALVRQALAHHASMLQREIDNTLAAIAELDES